MHSKVEEIKEAIKSLSSDDRNDLIAWVMASDDDGNEQEIDEAWLKVAEERMQEFRNGTETGIPVEQIFREVREKFGIEI